MGKKLWYDVEVECIKYDALSTMLVGEKDIIARVKSKGLAIITAQSIKRVYGERFNVTVK